MKQEWWTKMYEAHGAPEGGYLTAVGELPFAVKRAYWIYDWTLQRRRGDHAHRQTQQLFFCLQGRCQFRLESLDGGAEAIALNAPTQGLYVPPGIWHSMMPLAPRTVLLALASTEYDEADYIRSYDEWKKGAVPAGA